MSTRPLLSYLLQTNFHLVSLSYHAGALIRALIFFFREFSVQRCAGNGASGKMIRLELITAEKSISQLPAAHLPCPYNLVGSMGLSALFANTLVVKYTSKIIVVDCSKMVRSK